MTAHLEELAVVDDQLDELARVVGALAIGRDDAEKFFRPAVGRVARLDARGYVVGSVRQIRDELLDLLEGILFRLGLVVHLAALMNVHLMSAELFLVEHLSYGALDYGRS